MTARRISTSRVRIALLLCVLTLVAALSGSVRAQNSAFPQPDAVHSTAAVVLNLEGPWRFRTGDDLGWAGAAFDDSKWDQVKLGTPLADQGMESYSGYGWYRLHLSPEQLKQAGGLPLTLLVTGNFVGQLAVYENGVEVGHTQGMTDAPELYYSPPFTVPISSAAADGGLSIAIRTWASVSISTGLLAKVQLGSSNEIADNLELATAYQLDQHVLAASILGFLFFCVAGLGVTLYLAQRHHSEYLWLGLLCLSVAVAAASESAWNSALMPLSVFSIVSSFTGWLFIATTLEFVQRFAASDRVKLVRGVQIATLLLPVLSLLHLQQMYGYVSVAAEIVFCGMVAYVLFRAWRQGRPEAGIMLLPFVLAAVADSSTTVLDFTVNKGWLPARFATHRLSLGPIGFGVGTVAYLVFLGSLLAVILYRFVHVSQQEQRSTAEIEAARSVQALLIPTRLPAHKSFSLDSAYLPALAVGGDFFQVLPLADDSILLVVGDVSGKGLQAAMNASTLVGALRNELSHDPAVILSHLNQVMLGAISSPGVDSVAGFATCLCARVYPNGKMVIANAGHLSPYRDGRELELISCLPLGIVPDIEYEQSTFQLKRGDRLIFISDGVVEATDPHGELFGFERTQQVSHEPARYIAQTAQRFGQTDDITVVSLYFVPA